MNNLKLITLYTIYNIHVGNILIVYLWKVHKVEVFKINLKLYNVFRVCDEDTFKVKKKFQSST